MKHRRTPSFGIAAIVMGCMALLFSWIPVVSIIAFPVGLCAALFAVIGLVAAWRQRGHGAGFAAGGLAISAIAMYVAFGTSIVFLRAIGDSTVSTTSEHRVRVGGAVAAGDISVTIKSATVRRILEFDTFGGASYSDEPVLIVELSIRNTSATRRIPDVRIRSAVSDDFGNEYRANPLSADNDRPFTINPGADIAKELVYEAVIRNSNRANIDLEIGPAFAQRLIVPTADITYEADP